MSLASVFEKFIAVISGYHDDGVGVDAQAVQALDDQSGSFLGLGVGWETTRNVVTNLGRRTGGDDGASMSVAVVEIKTPERIFTRLVADLPGASRTKVGSIGARQYAGCAPPGQGPACTWAAGDSSEPPFGGDSARKLRPAHTPMASARKVGTTI